MHEPSFFFLRACGLGVARTNSRRYVADIPSLPGVTVHFQRHADIAFKVEEGSADVGIVGSDNFAESLQEGGNAAVIIDRLGFGHCEIVLGVPDSWVDVVALADLADLSMEFRAAGRDLRVATKFPRLVERFLLRSGVGYFSIVPTSGTLEAAPAMGYADIIADITETGVTMRENRLKTIAGGTIMSAEACLIANRATLAADEAKLRTAEDMVERIESHLRAGSVYTITANMRGETAEDVAAAVLAHDDISGLRGPTLAEVYTKGGGGWYAVTVVVAKDRLMAAVRRFREIGGSSVTVSQPDYVFDSECEAARRLTEVS
jgi:ATP phosphoribosyltransferase